MGLLNNDRSDTSSKRPRPAVNTDSWPRPSYPQMATQLSRLTNSVSHVSTGALANLRKVLPILNARNHKQIFVNRVNQSVNLST